MFKLLVAVSLFFTHHLFAMMEKSEYLMFIGNPGVGKSSLINALKGEKVAKSGISIGSGLTAFFTPYEHEYEGRRYSLFDTPGLDDVKMRQRAAEEIERALKQEGEYRLFFVITLEAGRIKPSDITTIEMVMGAIKRDDLAFNVIVNKLKGPEKVALQQNLPDFINQLNSGKFTTESIYYVDFDRDLEDNKINFFTPSADFQNFIYRDSALISIERSQVENIKVDQFEELNRKHEEELKNIKQQLQNALNRPPQVIHVYHGGGGSNRCCVQ